MRLAEESWLELGKGEKVNVNSKDPESEAMKKSKNRHYVLEDKIEIEEESTGEESDESNEKFKNYWL